MPKKAGRPVAKVTGRANALTHVKNPTARAAITRSMGRTPPAGNLAAQAKANINSMLKQGGGATTNVKAGTRKAVAPQRKPKR